MDVIGRKVSTNNEYRGRLVLLSNGRVNVSLTALRGTAGGVALTPTVQLPASTSYTAGSQLEVRLQVTGTGPTTIRMKVWPAGTAEPADWQRSTTDSTAVMQAAGSVGVTAYLSSATTNAPVALRMSALSARPTA
jgi:hypothetical protein